MPYRCLLVDAGALTTNAKEWILMAFITAAVRQHNSRCVTWSARLVSLSGSRSLEILGDMGKRITHMRTDVVRAPPFVRSLFLLLSLTCCILSTGATPPSPQSPLPPGQNP